MYKVMQKHSKKLMAIFAAVLMIAFVLPSNNRNNRTPNEVQVGQIGDQSVTQDQIIAARNEWDVLVRVAKVETNIPDPQTGQPEVRSLAEQLGPYVVDQINKHPVMFILLTREAIHNGAAISERQLSNRLSTVQVELPDGRRVQYEDAKDQEIGDRVRQATHDLLLMESGFGQSEMMIKVSQPLLNNRLAKSVQEIKLELVEFNVKDYAAKVPAPTTQQLTDQFNRYSDNFAGVTDPKTNPAGFGYKYPDRVKLAYISIPHDELKKAVIASQTDDQWQVKEWRYYKHNLSEFPSTAPTTAPTTKPTDALSLGNAKTPTTQPFEEARSRVLDDLVDPEADKLGQTIESKLAMQMRDDWNAYHAAMTATPAPAPSPTTAPVSSVGVAYDSPDYLTKVAAQIQAEFKVIPAVANLSEKFLSGHDLQAIPGIGKSTLVLGQDREISLQEYAETAEVFQPATSPQNENALKLLEPSRPLSNYGDTYIFRLTAADPAHKPASLAEVQPQVDQDVRAAAAYAMAQADANAVLTAAKDATLSAAAVKATKTVSDTAYLSLLPNFGPPPPVSTTSQRVFLDQAFDLLNLPAENKKPMGLIGIPQDQKVFIAQLTDVRRIPQLAGIPMEPRIAQEIVGELGRNLYYDWYSYDSVKARMNYKDLGKKSDSEG